MKVPPLIIGAALLFWGVETDNIVIGAFLGLLLEGNNIKKTRYNFTTEDFIKISDLTSLLFLGSVALILLNFESTSFLRITAGWLPLILLPLIVAQLYSAGDTIIIGTRLGGKKVHAHKPFDFRSYYVMICLFAAATGNSRASWFYPIVGLIFAWFLFKNRRPSSSLLYIVAISVSLGLGYAASIAMELVYGYVLDKANTYWRGYYGELSSDPFKSHVNFGDTGRLKTSGEIIMRVDADFVPPALFKEAHYSIFSMRNWLGSLGDFVPLLPFEETKWNLLAPPHKAELSSLSAQTKLMPLRYKDGKTIGVQYHLPKEKGLLPYPPGSYLLSSKTIFTMEQNNSGVVKVTDGTPVISYDLLFHPEMRNEGDQPTARNLNIPENEKYALQDAARHLDLSGASDAVKIAAIKQLFLQNFSYSLGLIGREEYATPLGNFLLGRKSGFCEYFATATTLLLRMYDIPSRYVVGYSVFEKSRLEGKYVVRKRHGHAWSEAFVDGRWLIVDTTPANWVEKDYEQASFFEGIADLLNLVRHQYRLFQIGSGGDYTLLYSIVVIVLTTFLVLRIYRRMHIQQAAGEKDAGAMRSFVRIISPFTPVLDTLTQQGVARSENESITNWFIRIVPCDTFDRFEFEQLYRLHLQMRHDPEGLREADIESLRAGSEKYLQLVESGEKPAVSSD